MALNDSNFRGSLKEAYGGKSMQLPLVARMHGRNGASDDTREDSDSDSGIDAEEMKEIEKFMHQGYRISHKDEKSSLCTLELPDEIKCRGKRPV